MRDGLASFRDDELVLIVQGIEPVTGPVNILPLALIFPNVVIGQYLSSQTLTLENASSSSIEITYLGGADVFITGADAAAFNESLFLTTGRPDDGSGNIVLPTGGSCMIFVSFVGTQPDRSYVEQLDVDYTVTHSEMEELVDRGC